MHNLPPESYDPNALKDIQYAIEAARSIIDQLAPEEKDSIIFSDIAQQAESKLNEQASENEYCKIDIDPDDMRNNTPRYNFILNGDDEEEEEEEEEA